jgi:hypothetical protein
MRQVHEVSLRFEDNGRFHDDLLLRVGDVKWRCDSYYLLIDQGMLAEGESVPKVRAVLARLLEQWRTSVERLADGQACFLPYDFSDEYTGWLRCEAVGKDLRVHRGWAEVNGYSFFPSDVGELLRSLPGFQPDGEEVSIPRASFLQSIKS